DPVTQDQRLARDLDVEVVVGPAAGAALVAGEAGEAGAPVDLLVRSPGIPLSHPVQEAAGARGIATTTALNIFFAVHRPDNVIALTATKGKSTTSSLLGHLLRSAGRRVAVAGNVGLSVLDLDVAPADLDHLVLELSSYQLADMRGRPAIGAWLNLHRDHHDWHGGATNYARDKARIVALSDRLVANAADPRVMAVAGDHPALATFDATADPVVLGATQASRASLTSALGASPLVGTHNLANLAAVLTIGTLVTDDPDAMVATMSAGTADFTALPHRLQVVHDDGRLWIDDSIATIPEATVAALAAFPDRPVTLLAGGFERGQDHAPLVAALTARAAGDAPVRVVALPDTGLRLADHLDRHQAALPDGDSSRRTVEVTVVDDLAAAVATAAAQTPRNGVVLLSPAAASFNQFTSFEERGRQFAALAGGTA
ncbi:MAG TPA: UDP-N-acetylmuramoyl-L-alanine--D-glutamate ligase, partial [Nitriliruptoraceae bacterium]|nr:UDP-N-acetylmuramoyl-L-alanine--D-glutamate ligase [Nitriliruptoraceae bacterium]